MIHLMSSCHLDGLMASLENDDLANEAAYQLTESDESMTCISPLMQATDQAYAQKYLRQNSENFCNRKTYLREDVFEKKKFEKCKETENEYGIKQIFYLDREEQDMDIKMLERNQKMKTENVERRNVPVDSYFSNIKSSEFEISPEIMSRSEVKLGSYNSRKTEDIYQNHNPEILLNGRTDKLNYGIRASYYHKKRPDMTHSLSMAGHSREKQFMGYRRCRSYSPEQVW